LPPKAWIIATYWSIIIFTVLVLLTSLSRTDSLNVTINAISIYLVQNPKLSGVPADEKDNNPTIM